MLEMHGLKRHFALIVIITMIAFGVNASNSRCGCDVLVVGGGASGIAAGVESARLGASTMIVEETPWLGGMLTSAGVSAIDGNFRLRAGFWGEFLDSLIKYYGSPKALSTGWVSNVLFEPKVGSIILDSIAAAEPHLRIERETVVTSLRRDGQGWIATVKGASGVYEIASRVVIDATELGDIAKMAGVKYDIGMESRLATGEDVAPLEENGIIQDLTYVAILKDYGTDATIERPEGYNPNLYACCAVNDLCVNPSEPDRMWSKDMMISYGRLPGGKYMINWPIEGNDYYLDIIEMTPEQRAEALKKAKQHTLGFVYFIQHELGFSNLSLADDEFPTADRLPFIPYHRESRRIHGKVRFGLNHITTPYDTKQPLYRTSIAVGDYPVDHHHARYTGSEALPRLYFHPVPSFGLPLGCLIPETLDNFIVAEKSVSVSNIVNGTTRLQPVVMQIGTAAGALAALATGQRVPVSRVDVREVQRTVLDAGGYIVPLLDVEKNSPLFKPYQRIASTGILRAEGRNVGWSNQTWLRADTLLYHHELDGFKEFYPETGKFKGRGEVTVAQASEMILAVAAAQGLPYTYNNIENAWREVSHDEMKPESAITRGMFAILVDSLLHPFDRRVDINGEFLKNK